MKDRRAPTSGFVRSDFIVTFAIADAAARDRLASQCEGEWQGTRITDATWELASAASPDDVERAIVPLLAPGDRVVYYYLSDAKRIFRVVLEG